MNTAKIDRRQFLQSGLIAGTLLASGHLPLLSVQGDDDSGIDASTGPYSTKPIRDYLRGFLLAEVPLRERRQYSLTYDIIHWGATNSKTGTPTNSVLGQVVIKREVAKDQVTYDIVQQTRIGGVNNFVEAEINCSMDESNSLRAWRLRTYHIGPNDQIDPLSKMTEKGSCKNGNIRIDSGSYNYGYTTKSPAVSQWTVPDFLIRRASPTLHVTFDLLQDLSLFKPNQSLVYDGVTNLKLKGGRTVALQTYAQTGEGVLPIHYLLDSEGRPQLITSSILSWALIATTPKNS
jgi:hypothetical protein